MIDWLIDEGSYSDQREFTIFYVGTVEGEVYKISQWSQRGELKSQLLDIFQVSLQFMGVYLPKSIIYIMRVCLCVWFSVCVSVRTQHFREFL